MITRKKEVENEGSVWSGKKGSVCAEYPAETKMSYFFGRRPSSSATSSDKAIPIGKAVTIPIDAADNQDYLTIYFQQIIPGEPTVGRFEVSGDFVFKNPKPTYRVDMIPTPKKVSIDWVKGTMGW